MSNLSVLSGWGRLVLKFRGYQLIILLILSPSAYAQIEKLTRNINYAYLAAAAVATLIFTLLVIHAGIEIGWNRRKIADVWPVLVGAAITGSGAIIAAALV